MTFRSVSWCLLSILLLGCGDSDAPADVPIDRTVDASDAPDVTVNPDVPGNDSGDAGFRCPAESLDPSFGQPCPGLDGVECRYGYTVPGCGGRTQTCRSGRWEEVHTDPSSSCFDGGAG